MKPPEGDHVMVARVKSGHQHSQVVSLGAAVGQVDHLKEEEDQLLFIIYLILQNVMVGEENEGDNDAFSMC